MRGFTLSVLTFLTFGIFALAAPTPVRRGLVDVNADVDANVRVRGLVDVDADVDANVRVRGLVDVDADVDADVRVRGLVDVDVDADVDVRVRDSNDQCLDGILSGVISDVEKIIDEISGFPQSQSIRPPNADSIVLLAKVEGELTKEILEPLLKEVIKILNDAINAVKALVGLDANDLLSSVTGILIDLDAIVRIVADLLCVSLYFSVLTILS